MDPDSPQNVMNSQRYLKGLNTDPCLKKDQSVSGYILFLQCCGSGITKGIFTLLRYQGIKRIMVQVVASRAPKSEFVNSF